MTSNTDKEMPTAKDIALAKIMGETAKIEWHSLQAFFAAGKVLSVDPELDLVDVVFQFSEDNGEQVKLWLDQNKVAEVSDDQAREWYESNAVLWSCVVKPWILVQPA